MIPDRIAHAEHPCYAMTDDLRWTCTLPVGHDGEHVASDGMRVMVTWPR